MTKNKLKRLDPKQLERIERVCLEAGEEVVKVGDIFHNGNRGDGSFIRVSSIVGVERFNSKAWRKAGEPRNKKQFNYIVDVVSYGQDEDWDCTKFGDHYGSVDLDDFIKIYGKYRVKNNDMQALFKEALEVIDGKKSIKEYEDNREVEGSQSLIHASSSKHLSILKDDMSLKKRHVEMIRRAIGYEMEKRKAELEKLKDSLGLVVADFQKKVKKLERIITTIELYLGINEDIIQIQEGETASKEEPITIRQEVLCMDEEVGDPEDDGLDCKNSEDFDDWRRQYSTFYKKYNYEMMIPEEKGVVVFRVRREEKEYSDNPWINAQMNIPNMKTYILIRNGKNLYRIFAELNIWPTLFPHRVELQELKDKWDEISVEGKGKMIVSEGEDQYKQTDEILENIDNKLFAYKRQILILQGLMDRTPVFHPLPDDRINIMKDETIEKGYVRLVYDDELMLPDERAPFWQWIEDLNKEITEGSRVLYIDSISSDGPDLNERLDGRFYRRNYSSVSGPDTAVYTVTNRKEPDKRDRSVFLNDPKEVSKYPKEDQVAIRRGIKKIKDWESNFSRGWKLKFPCTVFLMDEDKKEIEENYIRIDSFIYYNPGDTIYNWWDRDFEPHERKNRLSFKIVPTEDKNLLNYDGLKLDDVEYYLNSRVNRRILSRGFDNPIDRNQKTYKRSDYLRMMPILYNVKKMILKEQAREKEFIRLVLDRYSAQGVKEQEVLEAIEWWKLKNKWKRALDKDDTKAFRMIKGRLNVK